MIINDKSPHTHLTEDDFFRFIENLLDESERARLTGHLEACSECFERYQDSAMAASAWEAGSDAFELNAELVNASREVPSRTVVEAGPTERRSLIAPPAWFKRYRLVNLVAAAAVLVLAAAIVWFWPGFQDQGGFGPGDPVLLAPVRAAVETASARGPFILPGGERSLDYEEAAYRSGYISMNDKLEYSLRSLSQSVAGGDYSPEQATWLAEGYFATGQIDAARSTVEVALRAHPDHSGLLITAALIAHYDGDDTRAVTILRSIPGPDPNYDLASLNLAVVLIKMNNPDEARLILNRLTREFSGGLLGDRAARLLAEI
jgi:hypothetical protein